MADEVQGMASGKVRTRRSIYKALLTKAIKPVVEGLEVRRLLSSIPAGGLDTTFGTGGKVTTDFNASHPNDVANAVAPVTSSGGDQDLVAVGQSNGQIAVALYSANGALLGVPTTTPIAGNGSSAATSVAVDGTDGSGNPLVLVGGYTNNPTNQNDFVVLRYKIVGTGSSQTVQLDTSFDSPLGYTTTDIKNAHQADVAKAVAVDGPDVILAGDTNDGTSQEHLAVAAYSLATGTLDTGFGTGGVYVATATDVGFGLAIDSSNNIAIVGENVNTIRSELTLLNGPASATPGAPIATYSLNLGVNNDNLEAVVAAPNGEYLVAGRADNQFLLAEVKANGTLDSSFGTGGETKTAINGNSFSGAVAVGLQNNGKIVVAGQTDTSTGVTFAVARYNANGILDSGAFGAPSGYVTTSFGGSGDIAAGLAIQPDGQIVAAGTTSNGAGGSNDFALARYVSNNAPTAATNASLDSILQTDTNNPGTSVDAIVQRLAATDVDGDSLGIAVTGIDNSQGTWQYQLGAVGSWLPIPTNPMVSDAHALLLQSGDSVRFVPNGTFTGSSNVSLRVWDRTKGSHGISVSALANELANYNSFSDNTYTATIQVQQAPQTVYVDANWASNKPGDTVSDPTAWFATPGETFTFGINAYAKVEDGVSSVASGGAVDVAAGTYVADGNIANTTDGYVAGVLIDKPLSLIGPNAGMNPNSPPAANAQAVLEAGTSNPDPTSSTESIVIGITSSNVTIEGMTIDGTNPLLTTNTVTFNGAAIAAAEGITSYTGVGNINVSHNIVRNIAYAGIDFYNSDNPAATSDNTLSSNLVQNLGGNGYGIGVLVYNNFYAQVTGNDIQDARVGVQTGNFSSANSDSAFAPEISNNTISAYRRGIFYNLHYSNASPFTVQGNSITAVNDPTAPATAYWTGILISSQQSAVSASFTNNTIDGSAATSFATTAGVTFWNDPTTGSLTVSGGTISGVGYGVWLNSFEGYGPSSANAATQGSISGVSISAGTYGVYIEDSPQNTSHPDVSAVIEGNTQISTSNNNGADVEVSGANASVTFSGGGLGGVFAPAIGTGSGSATLSGPGNYITLANGAELGKTVDASTVTFGGVTPSDNSLADLYAVEGRITDYLDDATLGYVSLRTGNVYVAQSSESANAGAIQRGVNAATVGGNVFIQAGTFAGNVTIPKPLTLDGANAGVSGTSTSRVTETDVDCGGGSGMNITSGGVTINGIEITNASTGISSNAAVSIQDDILNTSGSAIAINGSGAGDVNVANDSCLSGGQALTYQWSLISAPAGSKASLTVSGSSISGATGGISFVPDVPGDYQFDLAVTDNQINVSNGPGVSVSPVNTGGDLSLNALTLSGNTIASAGSALSVSGGNVSINTVTLNANTIGGTVNLTAGGNLSMGALTLTGNTFGGAVNLLSSGGNITIGGNGATNETVTVSNNRSKTVGTDESITIGSSQDLTVNAKTNISVNQDEKLTVSASRTETVSQGETITISGNRTDTVGGNESITVSSGSGNLTLGTISATANTIGGSISLSSSGGNVSMGDGSVFTGNIIAGNVNLTAGGSISAGSISATGNVLSAGSVNLTAGGNITLGSITASSNQAGAISVSSGGDLTISGATTYQNNVLSGVVAGSPAPNGISLIAAGNVQLLGGCVSIGNQIGTQNTPVQFNGCVILATNGNIVQNGAVNVSGNVIFSSGMGIAWMAPKGSISFDTNNAVSIGSSTAPNTISSGKGAVCVSGSTSISAGTLSIQNTQATGSNAAIDLEAGGSLSASALSFSGNNLAAAAISVTGGSITLTSCNASLNTVGAINVLANGPASAGNLTINGLSTYQGNIITGVVAGQPVQNGLSYVSQNGNVFLTGGCVTVGNQVGTVTPVTGNACLVFAPNGNLTQSGGAVTITGNTFNSTGMGVAWMARGVQSLGGPFSVGAPGAGNGNLINGVSAGSVCISATTLNAGTLNIQSNQATGSDTGIDVEAGTVSASSVNISANTGIGDISVSASGPAGQNGAGNLSISGQSTYQNNIITGNVNGQPVLNGIGLISSNGNVSLTGGCTVSGNQIGIGTGSLPPSANGCLVAAPQGSITQSGNLNICANLITSNGMGIAWIAGTTMTLGGPVYIGMLDTTTTPPTNEGNTISSATGALCFTAGTGLTATNAFNVEYNNITANPNPSPTGDSDGVDISATNGSVSLGSGSSFINNTITGDATVGIAVTATGGDVTLGSGSSFSDNAMHWTVTVRVQRVGMAIAATSPTNTGGNVNIGSGTAISGNIIDGGTSGGAVQPASGDGIDISASATGGGGAGQIALQGLSMTANVVRLAQRGIALVAVGDVNGDGIPDLVLTGNSITSGGDGVQLSAGGSLVNLPTTFTGDTITGTGNGTSDHGIDITVGGFQAGDTSVLNEKITLHHEGLYVGDTPGDWSADLNINSNTIGATDGGEAVVLDMSKMGPTDTFSGITTVDGNTLGGTTFQPGSQTGGVTFLGGAGGVSNTLSFAGNNIAPGGDGNSVELNGGTSTSGGFRKAVTITGNTIGGTAGGDGIVVVNFEEGDPDRPLITGNVLNGPGNLDTTSTGIKIDQSNGGASTLTISGNAIGGFGTGVELFTGTTGTINATVGGSGTGNTFTNNLVALDLNGDGIPDLVVGAGYNSFSGNGTAMQVLGGTLNSNNNTIEINSFQFGIGRGISSPTGGSADREIHSRQDSADMTVQEFAAAFFIDDGGAHKTTFTGTNDIVTGTGTSQAVGLSLGSNENPTESVSLNFSKIIMKYAVQDNAPGLAVDMSGNYWGTNTEEGIHNLITGSSAGQVDYTPWLDNGTNSSTTGGFTGDLSQLDVGSGGAEAIPQGLTEQGRIAEALGLLQPPPAGSGETPTVNVYGPDSTIGASGIYNEDVSAPPFKFQLIAVKKQGSPTRPEILGDGHKEALTLGPGSDGSLVSGFTIDGGQVDGVKMDAAGVTLSGNTISSTNAYAVEIDDTGAGDILTGNTFEATGLGNVSVADGSNTIGGSAAAENTFTAPPIASEYKPGFLQFLDGSGSFDPNGGEIKPILTGNIFNRGVTANDSSLNFTKIIWADIQPAIGGAQSGDTVSALPGVYEEKPIISTSLILQGAALLPAVQREQKVQPILDALAGPPGTPIDPQGESIITGNITADPGATRGFRISSFFDVFTDISIPAIEVKSGQAAIDNNIVIGGPSAGVQVDSTVTDPIELKTNFIWMKYDAASVGYGINLNNGAGGTIQGNDIQGNGSTGTGAGISSWAGTLSLNSIVSGNTIRDNGTGFLSNTTTASTTSPGSIKLDTNSIYDNGIGIYRKDKWTPLLITNEDFEFKDSQQNVHNNATDIELDPGAAGVTVGDGNIFDAGIFYFFDHSGSGHTLDLSGDTNNTFDNLIVNGAIVNGYKPVLPSGTAPFGAQDQATLANNYALEDKIYDQLDDPAAGYVKIFVKDVFLAVSAEKTHKDSLQRAISVSNDGGNIYVQAGQFSDDGTNAIIINKAVTLLGAQAGNSGTSADRESSAPSVSEIVVTKPIDISSPNLVTLDGFDISAPGSLPAVQLSSGGAAIQNNVILSAGIGVEVDGGSGYTIKQNYLKYKFTDVLITSSAPSGNIYSNDLDGGGQAGTTGILSNAGPNATVNIGDGTAGNSNTIRNSAIGVKATSDPIYIKYNSFTGDGEGVDLAGGSSSTEFIELNSFSFITSRSILVEQGASATIKDNHDLGGIGIDVAGSAIITGNTVTGDTTGILVESTGNATIGQSGAGNGNSIYGNGTGIEVQSGGQASITNNDFLSTGPANTTDVQLDSGAGAVSFGDGNAFDGSSWTINNQSSNALDFSAFTGTTFGGQNPSTLSPANPSQLSALYGIEDKILDNLDQAASGFVRLQANRAFVAQSSDVGPNGSAGSIQRAVNDSVAGDTVYVQGGTFTSGATVNKQLTIDGAGAGQDARTRSLASETIINSSGGAFGIHANDVVIDGFTLEGETAGNSGPGFGYAIDIAPGVNGTHVVNNIVQNNIAGLALSNASGTDQAVVQFNLFQNNNQPGSNSGSDVYADQFTAGTTFTNVLIANNAFTNSSFVENHWGVGISNTSGTLFTNIQVLNNTFTNSGRGMYFYGSSGVTVDENNVSGATHYAVGLFGQTGGVPDANITISRNTLDGNGAGVLVEDDGTSTGPAIASGVLSIHNNFLENNQFGVDITSFALGSGAVVHVNDNSIGQDVSYAPIPGNSTAGLENDSPVAVDATSNWWGSASGPTNAANPGGTGDKIIAANHNVTFSPWLTNGADADAPNRADGFQPTANQPIVAFPQTVNATEAVTIDPPALVATFVDPANPTGDLTNNHYSADLNWGDGTGNQLNSATIAYDSVNGVFDVFGSHTYAEEDGTPFQISVQVHKQGSGDPAPVSSTANVAEATITLTGGQTVNSVEAANSGPQLLATFRDPGNPNGDLTEAGEYTVDLNWGDPGAITQVNSGTVTYDANTGLFQIFGSHTYAEEGTYNVGITLHHHTQQFSVASSAQVADHVLTNVTASQNISIPEGAGTVNVLVATFQDLGNPTGDLTENGEYTADINWGDGTGNHVNSATIAYDSVNHVFDVFGTHAYGEETAANHPGSGPFTTTVTVHHEATNPVTVNGSLTVSDPAVVPTGGFTLHGTEGGSTGNQTVATFTDPGGAEALADYSASIDWGDGTTTGGTIQNDATPGVFDVVGSHNYADEGNNTIKVTIVHENAPNAQTMSSAIVADAALTDTSTTPAVQPTSTEGAGTGNLTVATFTDANPGDHTADFTTLPGSVTIHWGDLTSSTGTVSYDSGSGTYSVSGSHTYAEEGSYPVTVDVADDGGSTLTGIGHTIVAVNDAALTGSANATGTGGIEGVTSATLANANFSDANTGAPASDFTIQSVTWGDTSTDATGLTITGSGGNYVVNGSHLYAEEGVYNFTITVKDDGGNTATITGSTTVGDAALTGSANATGTGGIEGVTSATLANANFSDANTGAPTSDFTIQSVSWGDTSTDATGLTITGSGGNYVVNGSHLYTEEGVYNFTITVKDDGGNTATITGSATVGDAVLHDTSTTPAVQPTSTEGAGTGNLTVATFTDANPGDHTADFTTLPGSVTIHWGDLTSSTGTVSYDSGSGTYSVSGSHTYAEEGSYPVTVDVADDGGSTLTGIGHTIVAVNDAALTGSANATGTGGIEGVTSATLANANFSDANTGAPASDFTIQSVTWGDTSTDATGLTITGSGGNYVVNGSHLYAEEGVYNFTITVKDDGGNTATITGSTTVGDAALTGSANATGTGGIEGVTSATLANANFSDANTGAPTSDFTIQSVSWGDTSTDATGLTITGSGGNYVVNGSHLYTEEGVYNFTITVKDDGGNTATITGSATVGDAVLHDTSTTPAVQPTSTEGAGTGNLTVATFTDANPGDHTADFTTLPGSVTIHWGDLTSSTGTVSYDSGSGTYSVSGSHTYAEEGSYPVTVDVADDGGSTLTGIGHTIVAVNDAALTGSANATGTGGIEGVTSATLANANFSDANTGAPASDFTIQSVTWGDTSTDATGLTITGSGGNYVVNGSHLYAEEGVYNFTITVKDDGGNTATITGSTTVGDAALTGSANATGTGGIEGVTSATLANANFSDANTGAPTSDFTIQSVSWGDTSTDATGLTITGSGGNYVVNGSHLYTEEGVYNFTITVKDDGGNTATITGSATVGDAALTGSVNATGTGGIEGVTSATLANANFSDANTGAPTSDFTIQSVSWGDTSTDATGLTITGSGGNYVVNGSHLYAEEGVYNFTITVKDDGGNTATITGSATVGDAALTGSVNATGTGGVEGVTSATLANANFSDANTGAPTSDFTIQSVSWGDTSTDATGLTITGSGGNYVVNGSHLYTEEGVYNFTITVKDDGGNTATITGSATVGDAVLTDHSTVNSANAGEGASTGPVVVATFSDANPGNHTADFMSPGGSVVIHWGDGSAPDSTGIINYNGGTGQYSIIGTHSYAEEGSYSVTVDVTDDGGSTLTGIGKTTVAVADQQITNLTPNVPANGQEGLPLGTVTGIATFTDPAGVGVETAANDFGASINWGDTTSSTGTIVSLGGGSYRVDAPTHTYIEEGTYNVTVTVKHDALAPLTTTAQTITIADAPLTAGTFSPPTAVEGVALTNVVVFHFTDADPGANAADFTALITPGDGSSGFVVTSTPSSRGQIVANGGGFDVQMSYMYAEEFTGGTFTVVAIDLDGGVGGGGQRSTTSQGTNSFSVGDAALTPGALSATGGVAGTTPTTLAAHFSDANTGAPTTDFSGTIAWGDGNTTPFTSSSVSGSGGSYTVNGSHQYATSGNFNISVTVNDDGGQTTTINGSTNVAAVTVAAEYVFYNNSKFDGNDPNAVPATDFNAVATDKSPLLPGGTGSFSNYTSFSRGLNGILIDFANLPGATVLTSSDFTFKVGNNNTPSTWATAPAPIHIVMGTDPATNNRAVDIVWADNAIQNEWLQITVLGGANDANTHLASNFAFYYGNVIGETGNSATDAIVDSGDVILTQNHETGTGPAATITNRYDFNRDGSVDSGDVIIARNHETGTNPAVQLITVPAGSAVPAALAATPAAVPAVSPVVIASGPVTPTGPTSGSSTSSTATTPSKPASRKTGSKNHAKPAAAPKSNAQDQTPLFSQSKITKPTLTSTKLLSGKLD